MLKQPVITPKSIAKKVAVEALLGYWGNQRFIAGNMAAAAAYDSRIDNADEADRASMTAQAHVEFDWPADSDTSPSAQCVRASAQVYTKQRRRVWRAREEVLDCARQIQAASELALDAWMRCCLHNYEVPAAKDERDKHLETLYELCANLGITKSEVWYEKLAAHRRMCPSCGSNKDICPECGTVTNTE